MKTRLDADKIEIVNINEVRNEYPSMTQEVFGGIVNRFAWDIADEIVMAVADLQFAIKYISNGNDIHNLGELNYQWETREVCSVCGEYLLIDDDAYTDEVSGNALCDKHSIMNEATNNYQSITDKEWEVREHCQDCTLCERAVFTPTENVIQEQWVCQRYTEDNNPQPCEDVIDECKLTESLSN